MFPFQSDGLKVLFLPVTSGCDVKSLCDRGDEVPLSDNEADTRLLALDTGL